MVMIFQSVADADKLLVNFRHNFLQVVDMLRSTDTSNDVLALCVHQELTGQDLFTGGGVTGKCNASTGIVVLVTKCHHLDVNSGTPGIRNIVVTTVNVCTGVVPAAENSLDSADQLFFGVRREVFADFCFVLSFELFSQFFEVLSGQLDVLGNASFLFHLVDQLFKVLLADFHNDVGVHLDKSSVAVVSPTGVAPAGDGLNNFLIQTKVEDGVHHAGHGCTGAGTNGNQQRILFVTEFLAGDLFHLADVFHDLGHDFIVDLSAVLIILGAGFGGNGEALGNRQAEVGHLSQVCAFTAQQLAHVCVAFAEQVAILLAHCYYLQLLLHTPLSLRETGEFTLRLFACQKRLYKQPFQCLISIIAKMMKYFQYSEKKTEKLFVCVLYDSDEDTDNIHLLVFRGFTICASIIQAASIRKR